MDDDAVNMFESLCETVDDAPTSPTSSSEVYVPNTVRCPFYEKPVDQKCASAKHVKRTQRHRSTAQSRLGDMTVGDIRYCFQQLRNAGKDLGPDMILYNGQSAGEFALKYLRETSTAMRNRRKKLSMVVSDSVEDGEGKRKGSGVSGIGGSCVNNDRRRDQNNLNVLEF